MKDLITEDLKDNILKITLNNPLSQNTLSLDVINNLKQIIINADNNKDIEYMFSIDNDDVETDYLLCHQCLNGGS